MNTYKSKVKNINSKSLYADVTDFVDNIIVEFSIIWESDVHRDAILEVIDEFLMELREEGRITQFNVICDARNNDTTSSSNGITNMEVHYRQDDCYNTTTIEYIIQNEDNKPKRR